MERIRLLFAPDDGGPSLGGFSSDEPLETEIITLRPGQKPPEPEADDDGEEDVVKLSKSEYNELMGRQDSTSVLASGLKELKEALSGPETPANVQQQPGESDADFEKRIETELFAEGKSAKAIREAVQRYGGAPINQLMTMLSQQNKRILRLDEETGPIFKRYETEIENVVKKLPVEQQNHPQVWEYALNQVKENHKGELEQDEISAKVQQGVREALTAMGLDPDKAQTAGGKKPKEPVFMESGGGAGSANIGGKKTRKVFATAEDKVRAQKLGVPLDRYLKNIGKM